LARTVTLGDLQLTGAAPQNLRWATPASTAQINPALRVSHAGIRSAHPSLRRYETYDIQGLGDGSAKSVQVTATAADGSEKVFTARVRIDTPNEVDYYRHGGILQYILRRLAA
jgi:hypothetical protein